MRSHRVASRNALASRTAIWILGAALAGTSAPASADVEKPVRAAIPATAVPERACVASSFGNLPVRFEPNVGQAPADVTYVVGGAGAASLTATGAVLKGGSKPVTLDFVGASPSARLTALDEQPGKANYLRGDDPSQWKTSIATYSRVRYEGFFPGVDIVWYGNGHTLEYDLVVAPGADPDAVTFELDGAPSPRIDADGALVAGDVRLERPLAYQKIGGALKSVASRYVIRESGRVAFELGDYDRSLALVIDPEVGYTYTFADASKDISIFGIAVDSTGAAYVAGRTRTEGAGGVLTVAAYVGKLNPEGTALVYSTTISGSAGNEEARDIAVDASGNAFITGFAFSSNFPTTAGAFQTTKGSPNGTQDAFVAKLGPSGDTFVYSSFLGGSGGTSGSRIAIDSSGNAYVTGYTQSSNFPTTTPSQGTFGGVRDAFLTKVNTAGSAKTFSTYLGGSQSDTGNGVAIDPSGNAYVVGVTTSTNFPVSAGTIQTASGGGSEAFWAKYDANGQRTASTYLGGSGFDSANGVAVDSAGNSYLTGETASSEFPLVSPVQSTIAGDRDVFITALNESGTSVTFSTYYGGTRYDYGSAIALDGAGSLYVVGSTESSNFPTVDPVQAAFGGGVSDAFLMRLRSNAAAGRLELPVGPTVESASYQGGPGRETGTAARPTGPSSVAVGASKQKDTGGAGHDEAGVTTYTYVGPPAPDLAVAGALAGTFTSNGERYYLLFVLARSASTCSADLLAPNATFGVVLPEGVRYKGVLAPNPDTTVVARPDVDHAGTVTFRFSKPVPKLGPNQEFAAFPSSAYILVTMADPQATSLSAYFFSSVTGSLECIYENNDLTRTLDLQSKGLQISFGSKTLQMFGYPAGAGKPIARMIGDVAPDPNPPNRPNAVLGLLGFYVYMSSSPGVQPIEANRVGFIPSDETFFDATDTPEGAYFVLTAVTADGESEPSNEVGGTLPSVSSLKVSGTKLVAKGNGFTADVHVFFADLAFAQAPKLKAGNTKLTQKGPLERGLTIGEYSSAFLAPGSKVMVLFVNGNGNAVAVEYVR